MNSALVNNKYRITRRIGGGSFGEIYMGVGPQNERVAIKFERQGSRCPQLRHEYKVYRELANSMGFCSVYYFGIQENYNVMVMDLLGPSLEDLFTRCSRRFSLKTVLQIADQILERIECLHSRHLIHRDIKPANFTIGVNETASSIFCVDFGLSKRFRHPKTLQHIPHRDGRSLTGTPRYASINNHLGIEQSRRDDLESVGYVLIYFLRGSLPWQGLKAKNAQKKYRMILEKKQQVSIAQLCQGLPSQFAEFLAYTRSLKFDAKPDIPYLRKLFRDLYHAQSLSSIGKVWDWDDMDMDYASGGDTVHSGGLGLLPGVISTLPSNGGGGGVLRPNTAAAVGGMADGDGMYDDEGLEAPSNIPRTRPSTTGNPPAGQKYTTTAGLLPSSTGQSSSWMYGTRPSASGAAAASSNPNPSGESDVLFQQRRPHTAHGSRGTPLTGNTYGQPSNVASTPSLVPSDDKASGQVQDVADEDGDEHVVAGARAMMRYRRTRVADAPVTSTSSGRNWNGSNDNMNPSAVAVMPKATYSSTQPSVVRSATGSSGVGVSTPTSAQVHSQGYPTRSHSVAQQQAGTSGRQAVPYIAGTTNTASAPWASGADRPKSASTNTSGGSKLFSSGHATGAAATTSGTSGQLPSSSTYGTIKNRFLVSGSPAVGTPSSAKSGNFKGTPAIGQTMSNSNTNTGTRSSKLFGLTR